MSPTTPTSQPANVTSFDPSPSSMDPAQNQSETLSPEEVHELRRVVINAKTSQRNPVTGIEGSAGFLIPKLPITEKDEDYFAETLMEGAVYSESFSKFKGKLNVKFRVRSRQNEEEVVKQIYHDYKDGVIRTDIEHYGRTNLYNLVMQVVELDNIVLVHDAAKSLRERAAESIFDSMLEPKLYILVSLLAQFEDKVSRIARKALEPDFSVPAAGI